MRASVFVFFTILSLSVSSQEFRDLYTELEKEHESENYERVIALEEQVAVYLLPRRDTILANAYSMIGDAYYGLGDLSFAADFYTKEKQIRTELEETNSDAYSTVLFNLTYLYNELGRYEEAKIIGQELIDLDEKRFGKSSEEYLSSLLTYADVLTRQEEYEEAIKLLHGAMRPLKKDDPHFALLLSKEADIHTILGHYTRAEKRFIEALALTENALGSESHAYASASANLALLYIDQAKFPQAEGLLLHASEILKNSDNERAETDYINNINNLALVHLALNQQEVALNELSEVLVYDKEIYGDNHPYLAATLINIGTAYNDMGRYEDAEIALKQALEISVKSMGEKSISYALNANNLANMYRLSGRPEMAIPLYQQAIDILKEALGTSDPGYITNIYNLGLAHFANANAEAEKLLKNSQRSRKKVFNKLHPQYGESTEKLAYWYWENEKNKTSEKEFDDLFENYFNQIDAYFPALSEEEKVNFFLNRLKKSFQAYNNYVLANYGNNADLLDKMLDHQLNTKALIMYATNKVRSSIMNSGDSVLIGQYEEWLGLKEQLARLFSGQNVQDENLIDSLNTVAQSLEKELGRKSAAFSSTYLKERVTWTNVQDKLKDGEAVIEILRFNDFTPKGGGKFSEDVHYVALIFTNKSKHPELIEIPDGLLLENRYINNYRNAIRFKIQDDYSYEKLWKPIGDKLGDINKIYFSPDGVYNQISINTLYNPQTEQYLLDEIDIRVLTNSKDLLLSEQQQDTNRKAYLLGYPEYNIGLNKEGAASLRGGLRGGDTEELTRGITRGMRAGLLRYMRGDEGITMLPGTKVEVENISTLYNGTAISQETVLNENATEHFIKSVKNPQTLHIATHGFFLPDVETDFRGESNKYVENPLLRSGLILAGAGDFLITGLPVDSSQQDGILTAYEAMNLNLDDTELVVLSACETGLGEIKNGEGVYGLQRAFMIAGADNVIMSMWSVDDDATQELMSSFYKEWIASGDKQLAFRKAQQLLKEKYKDPFYWGAFIMVGV